MLSLHTWLPFMGEVALQNRTEQRVVNVAEPYINSNTFPYTVKTHLILTWSNALFDMR